MSWMIAANTKEKRVRAAHSEMHHLILHQLFLYFFGGSDFIYLSIVLSFVKITMFPVLTSIINNFVETWECSELAARRYMQNREHYGNGMPMYNLALKKNWQGILNDYFDVKVDVSGAFLWGVVGGDATISDDGRSCTKGTVGETVGVRASFPLPTEGTWRVSISKLGTYACVGVAKAGVEMRSDDYYCLLGNDGAGKTWGVCYEKNAAGTCAKHAGAISQALQCDLVDGVTLRRSAGGSVLSLMNADGGEVVLFTNLPKRGKLYAVASMVYGDCVISIQQIS